MRGKARVERPMPYVRDSFWRGREFTSLDQMQSAAAGWSADVAGQRRCRPLEGAAPAAVFEATERDALRPLPADPFVLATWATAKIGPDIHAHVGKVLYPVPWRHIGKTADVRATGPVVQFFIGGDLVKTHPRKDRDKQTDFADYPPVRRLQRLLTRPARRPAVPRHALPQELHRGRRTARDDRRRRPAVARLVEPRGHPVGPDVQQVGGPGPVDVGEPRRPGSNSSCAVNRGAPSIVTLAPNRQ
jgi:Mu transposase, C-terminal domain